MTPGFVIVLTALLLGLLGSLHCVVMCGGIAGMLHAPQTASGGVHPSRRRWRMILVYNTGRIGSYMLAGAFAAQMGISLLGLLGAHNSRVLAQMIGGLFMVMLGLYLAGWWNALAPLERSGLKLWRWLAPLTRHLLPMDRYSRVLAAGIVWGWLPCGLVYSALALVLASGDPVTGMIAMGAFGLGTLPVVSALSAIGGEGSLVRSPLVRKVAGIVIILLGAALFTGLTVAHSADKHVCQYHN